jgi:hypothetical protein
MNRIDGISLDEDFSAAEFQFWSNPVNPRPVIPSIHFSNHKSCPVVVVPARLLCRRCFRKT